MRWTLCVLVCGLTGSVLTAVATSFAAGAAADDQSAMRQELMAAERAFARDSVEHGMRAAFLESFADDGVNFSPDPGNTKQRFRARPEAIEPFVLDWHPAIAAVSRAGDLGFTTGPYTLKARGAANVDPDQGVFFSIWKRQADGRWRVAVDGGVSTDALIIDAAFGANPRILSAPLSNGGVEQQRLLALESGASDGVPPRAKLDLRRPQFTQNLADDALLIVGPGQPLVGRTAISEYLDARRIEVTFQPLAAGVAATADLAYTYGRLVSTGASRGTGHYVNVWGRDGAGEWKILAELMLLPAEVAKAS